jgi:hypothetical protein
MSYQTQEIPMGRKVCPATNVCKIVGKKVRGWCMHPPAPLSLSRPPLWPWNSRRLHNIAAFIPNAHIHHVQVRPRSRRCPCICIGLCSSPQVRFTGRGSPLLQLRGLRHIGLEMSLNRSAYIFNSNAVRETREEQSCVETLEEQNAVRGGSLGKWLGC